MGDAGREGEVEPHFAAPVRRSRLLTPADMARNRAAVLKAARELFVERGYDAVAVGDIARRASVAGHVPGHYFGGKRMLFVRLRNDLQDAILAALEPSGADRSLGLEIRDIAFVLLGVDWVDLDRITREGPSAIEQEPNWRRAVLDRITHRLERTGEVGQGAPARQAAGYLVELIGLRPRETPVGAAGPDYETLLAMIRLRVRPRGA